MAKNVEINGIAVGGMSYRRAEDTVRKSIAAKLQPLTIFAQGEALTVRYPELSFTDNLPQLVREAKSGEKLTASVERTWADLEQTAKSFCERCAKEAQDAELSFDGEGFTYVSERAGVACDYARLIEDITQALKEGRESVELSVYEYEPTVTERALRRRTRLISTFTTYFDGNNTPRVNNIRLSASRISGLILEGGAEFSFNETVGLRTAENGYQNATVIQNGEFVDGIGGGVCQTSTTLFNAALLAGMKITESKNHTLSIGYVPPSLDAMVSQYSDLKFVNPYDTPVYLLSRVKGEGITFSFFGVPTEYRYKTESVTISVVEPPYPQLVEGKEEKTLRPEKNGLISESYLLTYERGGELLSRELIRQDKYEPVQGIYQILPE